MSRHLSLCEIQLVPCVAQLPRCQRFQCYHPGTDTPAKAGMAVSHSWDQVLSSFITRKHRTTYDHRAPLSRRLCALRAAKLLRSTRPPQPIALRLQGATTADQILETSVTMSSDPPPSLRDYQAFNERKSQ